MADAIARHYDLLDAAITSHDGVRPLEQGEGDSVVAAFSRASDAVLAALDAQRALFEEPWPTASPLRVRMAVHTGEARLRDDRNYAGQAVIRTARLRAIAHGGQVVISSAARDLVIDHLGDDVTLVDLGVHRLKDLARPEHVWQLAHADLTRRVPSSAVARRGAEQPAGDPVVVHRTLRRHRHRRRTPRRQSPDHAHRVGRRGQDPPRATSRGRGRRALPRRRLVGRPRRPHEPRTGPVGHQPRHDGPGRSWRSVGRDRRAVEREEHAARARQLRAPPRRLRRRGRRTPGIVLRRHRARDEPRPAQRAGRAELACTAARDSRARTRHTNRSRCSRNTTRFASSPTVRSKAGRTSACTTTTRPPWPRSAPGSTGYHWPSSSRRRAVASSLRRRSSTGSATRSGCSPAGRGWCCRVTRRSKLRSRGVTRCSPTPSNCFCGVWPSSRVRSPSMPPRPSYPTSNSRWCRCSTCSSTSWISRSCRWTTPLAEARFRMLETVRQFARRELERAEEVDALAARHASYFAARARSLVAAVPRRHDGTARSRR